MNAQDLYEEWTDGESTGLRPQRVKRIRDDIKRHTGLPVPRSTEAIDSWLDDYKGQVTRKLREHPDITDSPSDSGEGEGGNE